MVAFGHSSVGAIIGAVVAITMAPSTPTLTKIVVVFILGLLSHYLFDLIPHGHYNIDVTKLRPGKNLWIFLADTIGAFVLLSLVTFLAAGFSLSLLLVVVGMIAALSPDVWEAAVQRRIIPASWLTKLHRHFHFNLLHWHNQPHSHLPNHARAWSMTDIWQVVVFIVALILVGTLPKT